MFAGHFAVAAAVKAKSPEVPLWSMMVSTQLLDILFVPLLLAGVEAIEPVGEGYGQHFIRADYSHALVTAVVVAAVVALLAGRAWGKRSAYILGALTFSHWLLDLLVHRADMPILPGNLGQLPLLGLGLWQSPALSMAVEGGLAVLGIILYVRSTLVRADSPKARGRALVASAVTGTLVALSLVTDVLGIGA
jgi:hypothetical protein